MKHLLIVACFLFITSLPASLYAQFEGVITIAVTNIEQPVENSRFVLTATRERLLLQSDRELNVMRGLNTNGLLVRNDNSDFVFLNRDNKALQVKKSNIDGLLSMFGSSRSDKAPDSFDWGTRVISTGNKKTIAGYEAEEFLLIGKDDESISVWLTDQIKINWGMLLDVWHSSGTGLFENEVPIELIMNHNSFPLLVELSDNGKVKARASVVNVNNSHFNRNVMEIPENAEMMGLTDLMMNMFRQQ